MRAPPSAIESQQLRSFVLQQAAIVLDANKDYLLQSRLGPLLDREGLGSWDELLRALSGATGFVWRKKVVEALTTHETAFFRDAHPFDALANQILPVVHTQKAARFDRTLRIWSAAASTGQEIYSIAMLLRAQEARWAGWKLDLLATDLSTDVLARARAGRYPQFDVNRGLPAPMLVRWFDKQEDSYVLKPAIRDMVQFRPLNLIEPWPPMPAMDVVFLRNVLIYFDLATKRRVLERVADVMAPQGILFLGGVETTLNVTDRFEPITVGKSVCYQRR